MCGFNKFIEFYTIEEFLKNLCQMLEIVEKRINLKHSTSKSYNHQKGIKGEIINANDYVFAYNPRVTHTKLLPKKNGLQVVKEINDHLNLINANKCQQI